MKHLSSFQKFLVLLLFLGGISNPIFSQCDSEPNGIEIDPINNFIYWTDKGTNDIFRGNLDGSGTPTSLFNAGDGVEEPRDVSIDLVNNLLYWTKIGPPPHEIVSGNLDGSGGINTIFDTFNDGVFTPNGIDINPALNNVYWGEVQNQSVVFGDIGAATVTVLYDFADGVEGARGVQIDLVGGFIYWADFDGFAFPTIGRIFRGNLDGSGTPTEIYNLGDFTFPHSVALDIPNGLIYWTDVFNNLIQVGNIDGSGTPTTLYDSNDGVFGPRHLELNPLTNQLFWTEMPDGQIARANSDGTGEVFLLFHKTWDGGGDGTSWADAANWSDDAEPTATDKVYIPANNNVVINAAGEVAMSVEVGLNASLTINAGGDLNISGSCRNGVKVLENASLIVNGNLTIFQASDDAIDLALGSTLNVGSAGVIDIDEPSEDGIDLEGSTVTNNGNISIDDSEENGINISVENGQASSFTNKGTIIINNPMDGAEGNGIQVIGSQFDNQGSITISNTGNDGIRIEQGFEGGFPAKFVNFPSGSIQVSQIGDDGIEIGSANALFQNVGPITADMIDDKGVDLEPGGRFTNDCTVTITNAQDAFDIPPTSIVTNRNRIDIGLDAGSGNPALAVGGELQCDDCAIINITSDHEIFTGGPGVINNNGIITTVFAGANNNNATFNNNGEIRPATYTNAGNPINGNAPQAGAVPAVTSLGGNSCTACLFFPVPTLSEWGLIILALLIMTIGVLFVSVPNFVTNEGTQINIPVLQKLPFSGKAYLKNWTISIISILAIFTIAIQFFGYELTNADPFGALASSFLIAYLLFLLGRK